MLEDKNIGRELSEDYKLKSRENQFSTKGKPRENILPYMTKNAEFIGYRYYPDLDLTYYVVRRKIDVN